MLNGDDKQKEIDKSMIESLYGKEPKLFDVWNNAEMNFVNDKITIEPYGRIILKVN
jgi:hypothetical protein